MRNERQLARLTRTSGRSGDAGRRLRIALCVVVLATVARGVEAEGAGRAVLDPSTERGSGSVFRAAGFDPRAPRPLVLWRRDGERYLRLADTRSDGDGRFDFGLQPLPIARTDYAVLGQDDALEPSAFRSLERPVPAPIVATQGLDENELRVLVGRVDGELQLSDPGSGRLLARVPIEAAGGRAVAIDLSTALPRLWPPSLAIEHVLPDGRRSAPEIWPLERSGAAPR